MGYDFTTRNLFDWSESADVAFALLAMRAQIPGPAGVAGTAGAAGAAGAPGVDATALKLANIAYVSSSGTDDTSVGRGSIGRPYATFAYAVGREFTTPVDAADYETHKTIVVLGPGAYGAAGAPVSIPARQMTIVLCPGVSILNPLTWDLLDADIGVSIGPSLSVVTEDFGRPRAGGVLAVGASACLQGGLTITKDVIGAGQRIQLYLRNVAVAGVGVVATAVAVNPGDVILDRANVVSVAPAPPVGINAPTFYLVSRDSVLRNVTAVGYIGRDDDCQLAVTVFGNVNLKDCLVEAGGITSATGNVTLVRSTVTAGGIQAPAGNVTLTGGIVTGGGIALAVDAILVDSVITAGGITASGNVSLTGSTVSAGGITAPTGDVTLVVSSITTGGIIAAVNVTMENSTITTGGLQASGNIALTNSRVTLGGIATPTGDVTMKNSIIGAGGIPFVVNVTLEDSLITGAISASGWITAKGTDVVGAIGGTAILFRGSCTLIGNITASASVALAGSVLLAGSILTSTLVQIEGGSVSGAITSTGNVTIEHCPVTGAISTTGAVLIRDSLLTAGVTGDTVALYVCRVGGSVLGTDDVTIHSGYVGVNVTSSTGAVTLVDCDVIGNVTGAKQVSAAGGRIGGSVVSNTLNVVLTNCPVQLDVTSTAVSVIITGGSVGRDVTAAVDATATDCTIGGDIVATAGAVVLSGGRLSGNVTCGTTATVLGTRFVLGSNPVFTGPIAGSFLIDRTANYYWGLAGGSGLPPNYGTLVTGDVAPV